MIRAWSTLCFVTLSWMCASQALARGRWSDEPPACDRIESECDIRWGLAFEGAVGLSREESQSNVRAAFRFNFPLSNVFEGRTDFMLGGFPALTPSSAGVSYLRFGIGARADLQLNVGSVYTVGVGADIVGAFGGGLVGAHLSFLGFRFGPKREFFVNLPQQLWVNIKSSGLALEQTLSISFLFDL